MADVEFYQRSHCESHQDITSDVEECYAAHIIINRDTFSQGGRGGYCRHSNNCVLMKVNIILVALLPRLLCTVLDSHDTSAALSIMA